MLGGVAEGRASMGSFLHLFLLLFILIALATASLPLHHIGGSFEVSNFPDYAIEFNKALARSAAARVPEVRMEAISLQAWSNAHERLVYICDAVEHNNVTVFFAVGSQDMLNTLSIVTRYVGIPIIGYVTDKDTAPVMGERPLYLQMNPSKSLIAQAIVKVLESHKWYYASLITEDGVYATDGFVDTFKRLTQDDALWRLEDHIRLSRDLTEDNIDYKLLNLLENKSRVIILHCSVKLARKVFQVAYINGFTKGGYAWFVTENVITRNDDILEDYPIGLVAISLDYSFNYKVLIDETVSLVTTATEHYGMEHGFTLQGLVRPKRCWEYPGKKYLQAGDTFYRYMKNSTIQTEHGTLSFDPDGVRKEADFRMYNLIARPDGRKKWRTIGSYRNSTFRISTIMWPGETMSGPVAMGERLLRVVTNVAEPFVMEQDAINGQCIAAVACLRVHTKDKENLDDVFQDYKRGIHNQSRSYNVCCCQGLSIMLLERLARDLNFNYQLYITADERYGNQGPNGSWNGLVEDLENGAAHMAVAAFSITSSRSRVIDFTAPYFFSGFSILVSERRRKTPIYAFMEPFDTRVWISIVMSATVVAVVLAMLEWRSPFGLNPWGRKRKTNYTLGSGLNMVYAILFGHTVKTKSPKAWPSKWLQNFWAGASIFIYSSYTANLAAFLAGKNSGVAITGIHDPKLMEPGRQIGVIRGNAVEEFVKRVNLQLLMKARKYNATLPIDEALGLLMNGTIDAYLDDTPIVEYARATMDAKCQLRLVGNGFGEDAYGIGLPKNSWLKGRISRKILEYHESGFIEDLKDLYFRRTKCKDQMNDWQLQGEARSMNFDQHAGLYLLLVVGVIMCILLMFLEHATFKWLVPYWRKKPKNSFWKSLSMMFWSQRLYRIITSEELVSPHHSAREMIDMIKGRDFTKLFQKNVKKQERQARNRKNLFNVVEQLQWKQMKEELLSKQPSLQDSQDSDSVHTPVKKRRESVVAFFKREDKSDKAEKGSVKPSPKKKTKSSKSSVAKSITSPRQSITKADLSVVPETVGPMTEALKQAESDNQDFPTSKSDDELLQAEPEAVTEEPLPGPSSSTDDSKASQFYAGFRETHRPILNEMAELSDSYEPVFPNPSLLPLLSTTSSSEDNLLSGSLETQHLPNGMVIFSPNGDVFARSATSGKGILVRPKKLSNFKNFTTNLPPGLKTLPLKDNRVKSNIINRSRTLEGLECDGSLKNDIDSVCLEDIRKEDLYMMWKSCEQELNTKLQKALLEKADLEEKLSKVKTDLDT